MLHRSHIYGVMGEFSTPEELIHAVEKVREAGYRRLDAYAPFPVEGLSEALGLKRNMVPAICLIGGLTGGLGGFFFQYWVNVIAYPLNIGGRPLNSWPVFIVHRFTHASAYRFFLCIESRDPKFHLADTARILQEVHAHHVTEVSDD